MDLALLEGKLEKAFAGRNDWRRWDAGGTVVWRKTPAPLWEYVEEVADEDDRDEVGHGSMEEWPGNVSALLDDRLVDVLGVYWDGFGPISWVAGIQILDFDDHGYLCWWDETDSYQTMARLERWRELPNLATAVTTLLRQRHPAGHGAVRVASDGHHQPPAPAPADRARQGRLLRLAAVGGARTGRAWDELAEEHYGRMVEPNHLQRCLDILAGLPRLDDPNAVSAYLERDDAPELDDKARRRLFDEWFTITYDVTAPKAGTAKRRG